MVKIEPPPPISPRERPIKIDSKYPTIVLGIYLMTKKLGQLFSK
jgi:hypothetical protein